jgi:hypothetical protein
MRNVGGGRRSEEYKLLTIDFEYRLGTVSTVIGT